ncbi:hypothetical protein [Bacillus sp. AK128]
MRIKLLLFLSVVLLVSGCSNVKTAEDQNGLKLMTYERANDTGDEDPLGDGAFPPNQSPVNYYDATAPRPDFGTDTDKIRDVVDNHDGVTPGSVFINGDNAYVTVHSNKSYSKDEKDKLRHKLLHDITKAMPRYHIHVRVHDGDGGQ